MVRVGCVSPSILFDADANAAGTSSQVGEPGVLPASMSLDDRLREVEANLIRWALQSSAGNKSKAAQLLGVKRSTLGDRINRCHEQGFEVETAELAATV